MLKTKYILPLLLLSVSCIETFEIVTGKTGEAIIIEARLTDEVMIQEVTVSYTNSLDSPTLDGYALDTILASPAAGARVWLEDENGQQVFFNEHSPGRYSTNSILDLQPNISYTLHVDIAEGKSYISDPEMLPSEASLDAIYTEFVTLPSSEDETFDRGIQIFVDSQGPVGEDSWFRYEWEDAYEFHAPYISKFMGNNDPNFQPGDPPFIPRKDTIHICYRIERENETILATTQGQVETRILEQPIRFIDEAVVFPPVEYTIRVRQFSIGSKADQYYKQLKENNEGAGTFFDKQKGAILGNIHSISNEDAVLGYFELASVDEQRIFYTIDDFSNRFNPVYPCNTKKDLDTIPLAEIQIPPWIVIDSVNQGISAQASEDFETLWFVVAQNCADCRHFGSINKPALLKSGNE